MLLENHPLEWALVLKQGAGSGKKWVTSEEPVQQRMAGRVSAKPSGPNHTLPRRGQQHLLKMCPTRPCQCEDVAPSPRPALGSLSSWSQSPTWLLRPTPPKHNICGRPGRGRRPATLVMAPGVGMQRGLPSRSRAAEGWGQSREEGAWPGLHLPRPEALPPLSPPPDCPLWERFPYPRERPSDQPLAEKVTGRSQSTHCRHGA